MGNIIDTRPRFFYIRCHTKLSPRVLLFDINLILE